MSDQIVKKHIFEIKFTPTPTILDRRGQITDLVLDDFFNGWRISENRINIESKNNKNIVCFASYFNFGLISESPNDSNLFIEKSQALIEKLWQVLPVNKFQRFGVRTTEFIPQEKAFKELVSVYKKEFLKLSDNQLSKIGENLVDIAIPINFVNDGEKTKVNINTGPMQKKQASQFFTDESLLSETGVFIDIDYFDDQLITRSHQKQKDYFSFISNGISKAEKVTEAVLDIINKGSKKLKK